MDGGGSCIDADLHDCQNISSSIELVGKMMWKLTGSQ